MAKKEDASLSLLPVISHEIRSYHLPIKLEAGTDSTAATMDRGLLLLPGLNWCDEGKLRKAAPRGRSNVRLTVRDPTTIEDLHDAQQLAAKTTSKDAIRRWRALESRPEFVAMLDARLHGAPEQARSAVIASV